MIKKIIKKMIKTSSFLVFLYFLAKKIAPEYPATQNWQTRILEFRVEFWNFGKPNEIFKKSMKFKQNHWKFEENQEIQWNFKKKPLKIQET